MDAVDLDETKVLLGVPSPQEPGWFGPLRGDDGQILCGGCRKVWKRGHVCARSTPDEVTS
jgi:hypothetical protein